MHVLVTGADGFLGSNLVRELLLRGYDVTALLEPDRNTGTLDGLEIRSCRPNLFDVASMAGAMAECDSCVHAAASTAVWPEVSETQHQVNVEGTRTVLAAAERAGLKRIVHVGTANSFQPGTEEAPGTEAGEYTGGKYGLGYMDSKFEAHRIVKHAAQDRGVPVVEVNPTFMFGPFDSGPGPGRVILSILKRQLRVVPPGGRNYVSVKDVARGIVSALERGAVGESYILGNENLTYRAVFQRIAAVLGVPAPSFAVPSWAVKSFGFLGSITGRATGSEPFVSLPVAKISCDYHYYSAAKAASALGFVTSPIEQAVGDAVAWFEANGYVQRTA